jgi:hypothetical protein
MVLRKCATRKRNHFTPNTLPAREIHGKSRNNNSKIQQIYNSPYTGREEPTTRSGAAECGQRAQGSDKKNETANPLWGTPRIIGELKKLGITTCKATVDKYRFKRQGPPSSTWKSLLNNEE